MAIKTIKSLVEDIWNNPEITLLSPTKELGILNDNCGNLGNMIVSIMGIRWGKLKEIILEQPSLEDAQLIIADRVGPDAELRYKEGPSIVPTTLVKPGVYFISDGTAIKIGVANNVDKRLSQLQTGNPRELTIIKFIESDEPYELEKRLHVLLGGHRLVGEWFDISEDDIELFK